VFVSAQTKFGSFSQKERYLSRENLFKPSNRKDCRRVVLAEVLKKTGISIERDENFSDRVCSPCARKIRNRGSLYALMEGISQKTPEKRKQSTRRLFVERTPDERNKSPSGKVQRVKSAGKIASS